MERSSRKPASIMETKETVNASGIFLDGAIVPCLRKIVAEELQKERAQLLTCFEMLLDKHSSDHFGSTALSPLGAHVLSVPSPPPSGGNDKESSANSSSTSTCSGGDSAIHAVGVSVSAFPKLDDIQAKQAVPLMLPKAQGDKVPESKLQELEIMEKERFDSGPRYGEQEMEMGEESPNKQKVEAVKDSRPLVLRIVTSPSFEVFSAAVIMLNVVFMAAEQQYIGIETGFEISAKYYDVPAGETWPGADKAIDVLEVMFTAWFIIELVMRIAAHRLASIKSVWIWLDFVLVTLPWFMPLFAEHSSFDPSMFRMLRFLRILRMLRLAKTIGVFQALLFLTKAVQESMGALVWAFVALTMVQCAVGMILCQLLSIWIHDESNDIDARRRIFHYFGTWSHTMVTMYEISISNWVVTCRILMSEVSEWFALFYVMYSCFFMFGAVKVITAVFIAQTNRAVARDDDLVCIVQDQERALFRRKLEQMFSKLDTSKDGFLTWKEFEALTRDKLWWAWGEKLGIPMGDLANLFDLLAQGDGRVSAKEFFHGVQRLKGAAKSIDVVWLLSEVGKLVRKELDAIHNPSLVPVSDAGGLAKAPEHVASTGNVMIRDIDRLAGKSDWLAI